MKYDILIVGSRTGRLRGRDPRRTVGPPRGARRTRRGRRRLPQLGLHPHQSAAQERTGLRLLPQCRPLRAGAHGRSAPRPGKDRRPLARRGRNHVQRGAVPAPEEQHRPDSRIRTSPRLRAVSTWRARPTRPTTSSSPRERGRASCRSCPRTASTSSPRARR